MELFKAQYHLQENGFTCHAQWRANFIKKRDKTAYFLGAKCETACNQMFQLSPVDYNTLLFNSKTDIGRYNLKVRTIDQIFQTNKIIKGSCLFKYKFFETYLRKNLILKIENAINIEPLSYRVVLRGKKTYIQVNLPFEKSECVVNTQNGVVGLDFNDGFIQLGETNKHGNLVHLQKISLKFHGCGNSAKSEIREKVAKIVSYCKEQNKHLAIENLYFLRTKSKTEKAKSQKGIQYNKMLHTLDYSRYKETVANACCRNGIRLIYVNPAYTSLTAKQKYCQQRKLGIHQGASYVIARRAQGFKDKCKTKDQIIEL